MSIRYYKGLKIRDIDDFVYGGCVTKALENAFPDRKRHKSFFRMLYYTFEIECSEGCTKKEIDKLLGILATWYNKKVTYVNKRANYIDFCKNNKKGTFILNMNKGLNPDEHLSTLKNGIVYDAYYFEDPKRISTILGYWQIK